MNQKNNLINFIISKGYKIDEFAELIGVKSGTITMYWARGIVEPRYKNIKKMVEVLNCNMDDITALIGSNAQSKIRNMRNAQGMSMKVLAAKMNVSYQTVRNWEMGHSVPNYKNLANLAKIFDCNVDQLGY